MVRSKVFAVVLGAMLPALGGSACAMNSAAINRVHCNVTGAGKLLPQVGGADAICAAIRREAADKLPGTAFTADVRVRGISAISVVVTTADGRKLPEISSEVSDGRLTGKAIQRFAARLVETLGQAETR